MIKIYDVCAFLSSQANVKNSWPKTKTAFSSKVHLRNGFSCIIYEVLQNFFKLLQFVIKNSSPYSRMEISQLWNLTFISCHPSDIFSDFYLKIKKFMTKISSSAHLIPFTFINHQKEAICCNALISSP